MTPIQSKQQNETKQLCSPRMDFKYPFLNCLFFVDLLFTRLDVLPIVCSQALSYPSNHFCTNCIYLFPDSTFIYASRRFGCLMFDGLEVIAKIVSKKMLGRKDKKEVHC